MEKELLRGGLRRLSSYGLALCCLLAPAGAAGADWPMFRGNAERTGYASEQADPPLTKAWEFSAPEGIMSGPVIAGGRLYAGARNGKVYAFNARTGAALWEYQAGGWVDSTPAVSGGRIFFTSLDGYLYALDRLTGALLWKAALGASSVSPPLVLDGKVYAGAGSPENRLLAFDAATGAGLASYQAAQPVDSAPSTDGETVYFGGNDGKVYALAKDTLAPRWPAYPTLGSFGGAAVAVGGGSLYALPGRDEKKVFRLKAADRTQQNVSAAVLQTGSWAQFSSPVLAPDALYFTAGAGADTAGTVYFCALDTQTLSLVWASSPTIGAVSGLGVLSSPVMAGGVLYAGTADGRLVAVGASGSFAAADLNISSPSYSSPAVSDGLVAVTTLGGKIIVYAAERAASLSGPAAGALVNGTVPVKGYLRNPALAGYVLDYGAGTEPGSWTRIAAAAAASPVEGAQLGVWDTSALPNGVYTLRLAAVESPPAAGGEKYAYLRVRVNAPPAPPSGLTAADAPADTGNRIALAWTASGSPGVTEYRVYRSTGGAFSQIASAGPGTLAYTDAAAVTGSTFTYTVRAFDGYLESVASDPASACAVNNDPSGDGTPPAAPGGLAASAGTAGGSLRLTWTAPGNDGDLGTAAGYVIRYASYPGYGWGNFAGAALWKSSRPVSGPAGSPEAETVTGLLGGVTYYFALKAFDAAGNLGAVSGEASAPAARDPFPPGPPSGFTVADTQGDHGGSLTLAWTLSPDDGGGAGDVYGYRIWRRAQGAAFPAAPLASVPKGTARYEDAAAAAGTRFYYAVRAFDSTNESAAAPEASGVSADNWRFFDSTQGGTVRLPDGMSVEIPESAASQNDNILVTRLDAATYKPLAELQAEPGANPTGVVYEVRFENPATALQGRALITLPYSDAETAGMDRENLRIYTLSGGVWRMLNTSAVDAANRRVRAEVSHFSIFSVMEYVPAGALLSAGEVYTYPNPAAGDSLTFKFRPADKAFVRIDVYNVAGEQVASLEKANCPAGQTSEIVWGIKGVASGVYVYRARAESASGSKAVVKKLAIIH